MSNEVIEQGATKKFRPSDFADVPVPKTEGDPGYKSPKHRPLNPGKRVLPAHRRAPQIGTWPPEKPDWFKEPKASPSPTSAPKKLPPYRLPARGPRFGGLGRRIVPWLGPLMDLKDNLDGYDAWYYHFKHKPYQPGYYNWKPSYDLVLDCNRPLQSPALNQGYSSCGSVAPYSPSYNVEGTRWAPRVVTLAPPWPNSINYEMYEVRTNGWKDVRPSQRWLKKTTWVEPPYVDEVPEHYEVQMQPAPAIGTAMNPNVMRGMPTVPELEPKPDLATDTATETQPAVAVAKTIGLSGIYPARPRRRRPPRRRERERKMLSRSARIGIALFKILDKMSESAEVVDALYEALPEETRKKWKCNRSDFGIDQAGQYGIDNADCKAQALYHNFHKVDVQTAVENIIKNEIQDKILGYINRTIPRNTGSALDHSMMEFNDYLQAMLDAQVDLKAVW
ncbi:hypothetical protein U8326_06240 [Tsuneonella sp. CC-YZS046]|uniref:hypothetical protein n=1 Tax=Tsuneonella sp. CC-YZS046 TaxID=3042152 RepID=UPI002D78B33C|nr:hypothetical protein [Tsuneonella sp. CC-YZS046]WRO67750.1 hypothetical protein U8326_06240 [Tsuneonella sp. CC-YZS046]